MKAIIKIATTLLLLLFGHSMAFGQMEELRLNGEMKDGISDMKGAFVLVYSGGEKLKRANANSSGKYELHLDFGRDYTLEYRKQFYVTKRLEVKLAEVSSQMVHIGCKVNEVEISMIRKEKGLDYMVYEDAIARIIFNEDSGCFSWDEEFTAKAQSRIERSNKKSKKK